MIEQDVFLFSRTIAENIAFGKPGATQAEIEAAARAAQAHDFIQGFSDRYETVVGERGVTLSGGQRQRLALARAFLTDPRILILDDSTSSIDSATEDQIQQAIFHAARGPHDAHHHPPPVADPLGRPDPGAAPGPAGRHRIARGADAQRAGLPAHLRAVWGSAGMSFFAGLDAESYDRPTATHAWRAACGATSNPTRAS